MTVDTNSQFSKQDLTEIDRESFEPAYNQLANILRRKIATGAYRPGDRLPSEAELCSQYQVSTITSRRAIKMLVTQDIVTAIQGRGTFVKPPKLGEATFDLQGLQDIFADEKTTVQILEAVTLPADTKAALKLGVPERTRVIYIRRLIQQDNLPLIYHREYLILDPSKPTVESEMEVTALHGLFNGNGSTDLKHGILNIQATILTTEEATIFQLGQGFPAFRMEHTFYDFDNCAISWGWFICRGDRFSFQATLGLASD